MQKKPTLVFLTHQPISDYKHGRLTSEAEKQGFEVQSIEESDLVGFEVVDGRFQIYRLVKSGDTSLIVKVKPDVVYPLLSSSPVSVMGTECLRQCELLGIPTLNSLESKLIADNKWWTHQYLAKSGVKTPRSIYISRDEKAVSLILDTFSYPVVLKAVYGSHGQGVWLCGTQSEVLEYIAAQEPQREFLLQEYVASSHGKDLRVIVYKKQVLAAMQRIAQPGGFLANIEAGGKGSAFTLTDAQAKVAIDAVQAVGLDFAGVDLLFTEDDTFTVGEVNANPGFGIEKVTGVNIIEQVMKDLWDRVQEYVGDHR